MVTVDLKNEGQGDKQRGLTRSEKQLKKFFLKEANTALKAGESMPVILISWIS